MKATEVTVAAPDTFTDGALASLTEGARGLATRVVAEAGRVAVDKDRGVHTVYEDDVRAAFDHLLSSPKRWQKAMAYVRAIATFLAGVATAILGTVGLGMEELSTNLPWLVVLALLWVNALACITFIAYKES